MKGTEQHFCAEFFVFQCYYYFLNLVAGLTTCGLGLGKALLTDAERGISDPGGGLRKSKELLLSLAVVAAAENVIPVSLAVVSGTINVDSKTY